MKKIVLVMILTMVSCSMLFISCKKENDLNIDQRVDMSERLIAVENSTSSEELAKIVSPAVVGIRSYNQMGESVGTGVCVGKGGYIITNAHVVIDSNNLELYLFNGNVANATEVFRDESLDISILNCSETLPYLALVSENCAVGEDVLAVGTPMSLLLKHSYTKGIISALNRTLRVSGDNGDYYMQNLIQHDASLNPGNSGGPLINSKGEVVGINTLKIQSAEGLGFAIPSMSFKSLLNNYVKDEEYKTPYIGFFGYDAEIANYYQYTSHNRGVFVVDIASNSPVINSGLESGDVITKINDVEINNILDFRNELFKNKIGDIVTLHYLKGDKVYIGEVELISHPVNNIKTDIELINLKVS